MARHDILLDDTGDLRIESGDFVVGESDQQHVELLLSATKGSFLQFPTIGVCLANYVNKQNTELSDLRRAIEVNMKADGYKVNNLNLTAEGKFDLDYERS